MGWYDYALAVNALPIEAQAHQVWYIALYPEKLDPKHSVERYEKIFPNLRARSRPEQKRMLNEVIKRSTVADKSVNGRTVTALTGFAQGFALQINRKCSRLSFLKTGSGVG
jgi:hypothetical protein